MTNTSNLKDKSDSQLKELKAALQQASDYCCQQQGQFWGQGFQEGSDMFQKNAEEFSDKCQAIQDELDSRAQANLTKEQKEAAKDQPQYPPVHLAPADQPVPATQPNEPSTREQQQEGNDSSKKSQSSSTTSSYNTSSSSNK